MSIMTERTSLVWGGMNERTRRSAIVITTAYVYTLSLIAIIKKSLVVTLLIRVSAIIIPTKVIIQHKIPGMKEPFARIKAQPLHVKVTIHKSKIRMRAKCLKNIVPFIFPKLIT